MQLAFSVLTLAVKFRTALVTFWGYIASLTHPFHSSSSRRRGSIKATTCQESCLEFLQQLWSRSSQNCSRKGKGNRKSGGSTRRSRNPKKGVRPAAEQHQDRKRGGAKKEGERGKRRGKQTSTVSSAAENKVGCEMQRVRAQSSRDSRFTIHNSGCDDDGKTRDS